MKIVAVIPSRYNSTRLNGKPLLKIGGKPMVQHVYERVSKVDSLFDVVVATDDKRIFDQVHSFGGRVMMTSINCSTGSERVAEVVRNMSLDIGVILNVQGDEPFVDPEVLSKLVYAFMSQKDASVMTVASKINTMSDLYSKSVVKVVLDCNNQALYFSRSMIPNASHVSDIHAYKHAGIYIYKRNFLLNFVSLPATPLELSESLEQLRILEHGYPISVFISSYQSISVDTEEDFKLANAIFKQKCTT